MPVVEEEEAAKALVANPFTVVVALCYQFKRQTMSFAHYKLGYHSIAIILGTIMPCHEFLTGHESCWEREKGCSSRCGWILRCASSSSSSTKGFYTWQRSIGLELNLMQKMRSHCPQQPPSNSGTRKKNFFVLNKVSLFREAHVFIWKGK